MEEITPGFAGTVYANLTHGQVSLLKNCCIPEELICSCSVGEGPLSVLSMNFKSPGGLCFRAGRLYIWAVPRLRQLSFFLVTHSFCGDPAWTPFVHQPWEQDFGVLESHCQDLVRICSQAAVIYGQPQGSNSFCIDTAPHLVYSVRFSKTLTWVK